MSSLESYPPPFRLPSQPVPISERVDSGEPERDLESDEYYDPIPVIDFECLINQVVEEKNKLGEVCRDWGLFRLVNHGVPHTLLSQVQDHAREIFSLSFESKRALFENPLSYFWGTPVLTPSGAALSRGPQNINWVEGLNVPLSQLPQIPSQQQPALDSFRFLLEEYGKHLGRLATSLFEAMTEKLNLPKTVESKSNLAESTGFIRVYRYPPYPEDDYDGDDHAWGMDVHTDSSVLSILSQDQVGGLQVLKDQKWFTVKPVLNTLIVNLGDMMQALSDDEYKSVKHRVKVNQYTERVSICYFAFPGEGSVIRSSRYKPFTYADFQAQVQKDVKALGYKVGLQRFKLNSITEAC